LSGTSLIAAPSAVLTASRLNQPITLGIAEALIRVSNYDAL
jgi:hypothetical protein